MLCKLALHGSHIVPVVSEAVTVYLHDCDDQSDLLQGHRLWQNADKVQVDAEHIPQAALKMHGCAGQLAAQQKLPAFSVCPLLP